ncbi:MAG: SUMF1/EgtB/PvdO family nonheme iron enzyme, partial [Planctomycetota bacterium]
MRSIPCIWRRVVSWSRARASAIRTVPAVVVATLLGIAPLAHAQTACDADVSGDDVVNAVDLAQVLGQWGDCLGCTGDITGDGRVDAVDLAAVLGRWGEPCIRPTIIAIAPFGGPVGGGTTITITGTNLLDTTAVTVGGTPVLDFAVLSSTRVAALTPPGVAGPAPVSLTSLGETAIRPDAFTYASSWCVVLESAPDPAVVTSASARAAIAATGFPWRVRDVATGIEMVLVPGGVYDMGCSASDSSNCDPAESPVHAVSLTNAFYIGRHEVTQAQWRGAMGSNPSSFPAGSLESTSPVDSVSWDMAQDYVSIAGVRLPTEAEWERAYRAGTTTAFHG